MRARAKRLAVEGKDESVEDQVIVFRILPRGLAAGVFEYLNLAAQELLLKTMAKDDVAALLTT